MASIDNIVSKNVGKLGKRFLGGVSRKNAERAVSETANEVKDVFLKDKQKTVDSMLKNIETMKTNHISEINKKSFNIKDLQKYNAIYVESECKKVNHKYDVKKFISETHL